MSYPSNFLVQTIVRLFRHAGVEQLVLSPGSRNAPLMVGFSEDPSFECHSVVDERSAAFFALGLAQASKKPVAVVCTSGSAVVNYFPAVAEAFYSDIPLIVVSADRPSQLIEIGDGQTIQQEGVFGKHVEGAFNCLEAEAQLEANLEGIRGLLKTCIDRQGPVHLNVPLAEPLYDLVEEPFRLPEGLDQAILPGPEQKAASSGLELAWNKAKRILLLTGVMQPDTLTQATLEKLLADPRVLLMTETTSNIHHPKAIWGIDQLITGLDPEQRKELQPDLLVSLGGMVVSKRIKAFLRKYPPAAHYHIHPKKAYDTYFSLTSHVATAPEELLAGLAQNDHSSTADYQSKWLAFRDGRLDRQKNFMETVPYSDLAVYKQLLLHLPQGAALQLANSTAIRYSQLYPPRPDLAVYCNRGTSGIDGSSSTAIGHAVGSDKQTVLISGDLSFFYDSNALWLPAPSDFKLVVVNNSGGGIFRILPGARKMTHFTRFFETRHQRTAEGLAAAYGWGYQKVASMDALKQALDGFYQEQGPAILEVCTPPENNDAVLSDYFKTLM